MIGRLVGFRKFRSKKGNDCCLAQIERDLTPYEIENGYFGKKTVEEVGLFAENYDLLKVDDCGKNIEYSFGSRGFLQSFTVLK